MLFLLAAGNRGAARHTEDVDVIVNITTQREYYAFSDKLRSKGFSENVEDGVICRWNYKDANGLRYKLDVMPISEEVLGFSNKWYEPAMATAQLHTLSNNKPIKVIEKCHFLGTKFEAFNNRSGGDYYSHDMEDIIFIIEHNPDIMLEIIDLKNTALKEYLALAFQQLSNDTNFLALLPGMLDDQANAKHVGNVIAFKKYLSA